MAFPLFDLPDEALELVLGLVGDLEDRRALRLVAKRSRAIVDGGVVAVSKTGELTKRGAVIPVAQLSALAGAPWQLLSLKLVRCGLVTSGVVALAAAAWPGLQRLM